MNTPFGLGGPMDMVVAMMRTDTRLVGLTGDERAFLRHAVRLAALYEMRPDHVFSGMEASIDKQIDEARKDYTAAASRIDHNSLIFKVGA